MNAMVLAAGLGTRLMPLTRLRPKCLMPVGARSLLGLWLERLAGWGVERAVVNTHHLAPQVRARIAQGWPGLEVAESHEPEIMGTGGALAAARELLGPEPFLLANADVICTADLLPLMELLGQSSAMAVMGVVDDARFNTVAVGQGGRVLGFKNRPGAPPDDAPGVRWLTYTGLAAISPGLAEPLPRDRASNLVFALEAARAAGQTVLALELEGLWDDLGTPERLWALHRDLARGGPPGLEHLAPPRPLWQAAGATLEPGARVQGFCFVGPGARVEAGAVVRDSLILPGARVAAGAAVTGAVLGDGFTARGVVEGGAHA